MTGDDLERVLARLNGAYPGRLTGDTLTAWTEELANLDFSPAYAAVRQIIRSEQRLPAIAVFLEAHKSHQGRQTDAGTRTVCARCEGHRFIEVKGGTIPTVHPCPACSRDLYDRWSHGAFDRRAS